MCGTVTWKHTTCKSYVAKERLIDGFDYDVSKEIDFCESWAMVQRQRDIGCMKKSMAKSEMSCLMNQVVEYRRNQQSKRRTVM